MVLQLKWRHQFQFAGYYAAIEKGFYREVGLEVELREAFKNILFAEEVTSGRADFGIDLPDLLLDRSNGYPVVVLAAILQHSPEAVLVRSDSGIRTPQDLVGKTLMLTKGRNWEIRAMLVKEGLKENDVKIIPHSWDFQDVVTGKVDASSCYCTNELFAANEQGGSHQMVSPKNYGIDYYGDCLFTSEDQIQNHPGRVKAFLAASLRGWEYAMKHPEEMVSLILDKYKCRLSEPNLRYEAKITDELMLPEFIEIGHMNPGRWRHIADTYASLDLLPKDYPLDKFLYDPEGAEDDSLLLYLAIGDCLGAFLLMLIFVRVWMLSKERYLSRWVWAWLILTVANGIGLLAILYPTWPYLELGNQICILSSALLLLSSSLLIRGRSLSFGWWALGGAVACWCIIAEVTGMGFMEMTLLPSLLFCVMLTRTGVGFARISGVAGAEKYLAASGFFLWAIHMLDYPFMRTVVWFAPWGFGLAAVIKIFTAICILLVYFKKIRQELVLSELRFDRIFDQTRDALLILDAKMDRVLSANHQAHQMLGWEPDTLRGVPLEGLFQKTQTAARSFFQGMANQSGGWFGELVMTTRALAQVPVEISASNVQLGNTEFVIATARDITARKRIENDLRSSEERFRVLVDHAPECIVVLNAKTGNFVDANVNAERLFGLDRNALLKVGLMECSPAHQPNGQRSEDVVAPYIAKAIAGGVPSIEWTHKNTAGRLIPCQVTLARLPSSGDPLVRGSVTDISSRKLAEEEMRRLRSLLSNIINSMPSILVGVDQVGRITQWNRQAELETGKSAKETFGLPLEEVLPMVEPEIGLVEAAIATRRIEQARLFHVSAGDEKRILDLTVYPLGTDALEAEAEGGVTGSHTKGAVVRLDDVTQRVRMEELAIQSEKMISVGGLAAGMAHEINNPLAGILQNVQVIRNRLSVDAEKSREAAERSGTNMESIAAFLKDRRIYAMLEAVMDSGERGAQVVRNMLDFSRKSEQGFEFVALDDLLDKTLEIALNDYDLEKQYDFRRIEIVRTYDNALPKVLCEGTKVQQVFLNILRNGSQAMAAHLASDADRVKGYKPCFRLRIYAEADMACVEVEDNGPGLDEKTRKRIFEPFFTTKPVGAGTGLGLYISYFIITKNHRGTMEVISQKGKGTTFIVRLPLPPKGVVDSSV